MIFGVRQLVAAFQTAAFQTAAFQNAAFQSAVLLLFKSADKSAHSKEISVTGVSIPEGLIPENPTGHTVWDEQRGRLVPFLFGVR